MGGWRVNAVVDLKLLKERVAEFIKGVSFVRALWRSFGGGRKFAVEFVELGRFLEWKAEAWRKVVVLGVAGVDVGSGLAVKMTINKVSGVPKVCVFRGILTGVDDVVDIAEGWIFQDFRLKWEKEDAVFGEGVRWWQIVGVRRTDGGGVNFFAVGQGDVNGAG